MPAMTGRELRVMRSGALQPYWGKTGHYTMEFFSAARRLYEQSGFVPSGPFGGYTDDPLSVSYTLALAERDPVS